MNYESCKQIERQLRKLGHSPKDATLYSRFLFLSTLSVCGIIDSLFRTTWPRNLCDKTPRFFVHFFATLIVGIHETTGTGITWGPRAVDIRPTSSRIQRY